MISQLKQQDVDLWEAWIEYDQFDSSFFGTLYIIGEIRVDQKSEQPPELLKNSHYSSNTKLILHAPPRSVGHSCMKEVLYSERVKNPAQYTSIRIYSGDNLIARFSEIEVLF